MYEEQQDMINNYRYTKEDIEKSIEDRKNRNKFTNIGMEKTRIGLDVKAAKDNLDDATREKKVIETELRHSTDSEMTDELLKRQKDNDEQIENYQNLYREKLDKQKKLMEKDDKLRKILKSRNKTNLSEVNNRNVARNKKTNFESYKQRKEVTSASDLYARRKVTPKNLWEVGQGNNSNETSESNNDKTSETKANNTLGSSTSTNDGAQENTAQRLDDKSNEKDHKSNGNSTDKNNTDIQNQSHEFSIGEDLLGGLSLTPGETTKAAIAKRVRKGLSLQEYLERKKAGTLLSV